jgi:hypothetical protein
MKLFNWGKKEEMKAVVLGANLAALFGAEAGQELVVMASPEGQERLASAEQALATYQAQTEEHVANLVALTEVREQLDAEKAAHADTQAAFEAFKKEPAAEHTEVEREDDPVSTTTNDKPLADYQIAEQRVRQKAAKAVKNSK